MPNNFGMKKIFIILLISFPFLSFAQNVGIGTTTPSEKLEVKNVLRSTAKISSNGFNDTTELLLSNRTSGNIGTDFSIKNIREEGLFFSSLSDIPGNTNSNSLIIKPGGNVGIGIVPAAANKFHVNGVSNFNGLLKLEGLNLVEFGAGVAGKEVNAGKVGYNAFGTTALTFVGAGTNATNRAVYFFAEGGTTFTGPALVAGNLNFGGQLQVNGNSGTSGQILTSNGLSNPTWKDAAYGNNIRFAVTFEEHASAPNGIARINGTRYNINPTEVIVNANDVIINRSGLYHFDIIVQASVGYSGAPTTPPTFYLGFYNGLPSPFALTNYKLMSGATTTSYSFNETYSIEVYVVAPASIRLFHNFSSGGSVASRTISGFLIGHLINE